MNEPVKSVQDAQGDRFTMADLTSPGAEYEIRRQRYCEDVQHSQSGGPGGRLLPELRLHHARAQGRLEGARCTRRCGQPGS